MRFHLGEPPIADDFEPEDEGWTPLNEPSPLMVNVLAIPFGVCAAGFLAVGWDRPVALAIEAHGSHTGRVIFSLILLAALGLGMLAIIAVHELIHGFAYPYFGLTRNTVLGVWPSRLLFYAGYLKGLRRDRWVLVYLLPFLVLSVVPLLLYRFPNEHLAVPSRQDQVWSWLYFLSLLNGLFSGGDLLYVVLMLLQVPRRAVLRNQGWSTWWKVPGATSEAPTHVRWPN